MLRLPSNGLLVLPKGARQMNRGRHCTYHAAGVRFELVTALRNHPLRFSVAQIAKILSLPHRDVAYFVYDERNKARHRCAGK